MYAVLWKARHDLHAVSTINRVAISNFLLHHSHGGASSFFVNMLLRSTERALFISRTKFENIFSAWMAFRLMLFNPFRPPSVVIRSTTTCRFCPNLQQRR